MHPTSAEQNFHFLEDLQFMFFSYYFVHIALQQYMYVKYSSIDCDIPYLSTLVLIQ